MTEHGEFRDPRLVEVYDAECTWGPDDDLYVAVVQEERPRRLLDLGCGTGRLTLAIAALGVADAVTGVDPAAASLAAARAKPGADAVTWIEGTSRDLPDGAFDHAFMTAHVAQFFATDEQWDAVLADLARAVVPGGGLAFESRDPAAREWERWNPVDSRRTIALPDGTAVTITTEVTSVVGEVVSFTRTYAFADGSTATSEAALAFRDEEKVRASLARAGFAVDHVWGGWRREPVGAGDGELVVLARRT